MEFLRLDPIGMRSRCGHQMTWLWIGLDPEPNRGDPEPNRIGSKFHRDRKKFFLFRFSKRLDDLSSLAVGLDRIVARDPIQSNRDPIHVAKRREELIRRRVS